jgi:release factor glutamine methyltransferase
VTAAHLDQGNPVETLGQLAAGLSFRLHSESEANWIVAQAADIAPGSLLTVRDTPVSAATIEAARAMAERRSAGEPLQYVLGSWSFRLLEVSVDARALVPRPETEQVVEMALGELRRVARLDRRRLTDPLIVVDLGTGSGVIALSLALEGVAHDDLEIWAVDASPPALELARENLGALADRQPAVVSRVHLAEGSWFEALPDRLAGSLHLVVSNPPYVSATEWAALDPEVRDHEPRTALVPGPTGFEALDYLVHEARRWLVPGGGLVLELAPHQAVEVTAMAEGAGYLDVRVRPDMAGRPRTLVARWSDVRR